MTALSPRSPATGFPSAADRALVDSSAERLRAMFELVDCWYEPFPFDAQMPRIEPGRIVLPAAEPGVARWSYGGGIELPVRTCGGLLLGRFVLAPAETTSGVVLSPQRRAIALRIAEAVGARLTQSLVTARSHDPGRG